MQQVFFLWLLELQYNQLPVIGLRERSRTNQPYFKLITAVLQCLSVVVFLFYVIVQYMYKQNSETERKNTTHAINFEKTTQIQKHDSNSDDVPMLDRVLEIFFEQKINELLVQ